MEHAEVRWTIASSCCWCKRHLLSVSSFKILFLKQFVLIAWSCAVTIVLSVYPLMSPNFSSRYNCSLSIILSSTLRSNCPRFLFPRHIYFVFSAMLSIICLFLLCSSVLRRLAVCNNAQLMLWWCLLTVCVRRSSLLPTYSTSFVIIIIIIIIIIMFNPHWPLGLKHGSAAAHLLGLRVRIPTRAWMSVWRVAFFRVFSAIECTLS